MVKEPGRKIILAMVFLTLATGSFFGIKLFNSHGSGPKAPRITRIGQSLPLDARDNKEEGAMYHRYGRPVSGPLIWENDRRFHECCAKFQTSVKMSAFQTILPDPLPGEEYNVALAADILAGTVVPPGKIFSTNLIIGPYNSIRGYREGPTYLGAQMIKTIGGGVCKIATTLYNVATLANLKIIERRQHGMLVPYVPPGQDATVSDGNKDFRFKNNTGHSILIWADTSGNTLYMAIYGRNKPPKVTWHHQIFNRREFRTVYRNNQYLKPGEEKVVIPGAEGMTVKSWLTIEEAGGIITRRDLSLDYYRPMMRVIERRPAN